MKDICDFLVANWQPIVSAFLSLVAVILVVIKKRPSANSLMHYIEFICSSIPNYINEAEKTGYTGSRKFAIVLGKCMNVLHRCLLTNEDDDRTAKQIFTAQIEAILSTPQKKD